MSDAVRPGRGRRRKGCLGLCLALLGLCGPLRAGADTDLASLSLEELMDVEVNLTARREEPLFETAAAVAVLTADDLRRAGVTSIPEALRLVPGMTVARTDASKWAVSARGFNGVYANKLLVLIDGRSVYTPTFNGVFWAVQDVLLADVERIEVVRGPGATLWGTNAVNGIVNVVTRSAGDTQGDYAAVGGGTEERAFVEARRGGRRDGTAWRVWGRGFARDALVDSLGQRADDDWSMTSVGFRVDDDAGTWTVQGDAYGGRTGQTFRFADLNPPYRRVVHDDTEEAGGNLLGRWTRRRGDDGSLRLRAYVDVTHRDDVLLRETRTTVDLDLQRDRRLGARYGLVWGLGYRVTTNDTRGSFAASLDPAGLSEDVVVGFLQGSGRWRDEALRLTAGSKWEHNDHTGFEWQPSARLWWRTGERQALWASASRALRIPSQADEDIRLNLLTSPPGAIFDSSPVAVGSVLGSRDMEPERLTAYEAGYRTRLTPDLALDAAVFYNDYTELRTGRVGFPYLEAEPAPEHLVVPYTVTNGLSGQSWGLEVAADWHVVPNRWRLRASWSWLHMDLMIVDTSDPRSEDTTGENPEHQAWLWSSADLTPALQLDTILRYVDALPYHGFDAYLVADARLAWTARPGWQLEVVGRNLGQRRHPEFRAFFVDTEPTQTQSEVYAGLRWSPAP